MGREYAITFAPTAVTTAVDLFEVTPAANKPVKIHAVYIGQTTEVGDAQEEMLAVEIHRGGTAMTSGAGGAAATPVPLDPSDAAAGAVAEVLNTTLATFTGGVVLHRDAFNVRSGWQWIPPPEDRPTITAANGGFVVRLPSAPVDSITFIGTLVIEEIG